MEVVDKASAVLAQEPYAKKAFFFLRKDQFPRNVCIALLEKKWFDAAVLVLIVLNMFTMVLFIDPIKGYMYESEGGYDHAVTVSRYADRFMTASVLRPLSCETLGGLPPCSVSEWIDFLFLLAFTMEFIIKLIGLGFVGHKNSYFRSGWNWLDAIVVITGWMTVLPIGGAIPTRPLRLFKVLRPLRSLQRVRGMKVLVQCIMAAMPQLCSVISFLLFVLIVFGIIGIQLFSGSLRHSCHYKDGSDWVSTGDTCDPICYWNKATQKLTIDGRNYDAFNLPGLDESTGSVNISGVVMGACHSLGMYTKGNQTDEGGRWYYTCRKGFQCRCSESGLASPVCSVLDNPFFGVNHFDSLPWAMVTIFQSISLEGWVDVMYTLMDGSGVFVFVYFICVVLLGAIIVINLFLAVLCDNFDMANNEPLADLDENDLLDEEPAMSGEDQLKEAMKELSHTNVLRQKCLDLYRWRWFEPTIYVCIIFNTFLMIMKFYPTEGPCGYMGGHKGAYTEKTHCFLEQFEFMWEGYFNFLFYGNVLLTLVFVFESAVKIIALGPRLFARDSFNIFDVIVVIVSVADLMVNVIGMASGATTAFPGLSVLRACRIIRLAKLVRASESLRTILSTLYRSLKSVGYLAALLVLFITIFALLGMELFGGFYVREEYNYTQAFFPEVFNDQMIDRDWKGDPNPAGAVPFSRYNFDDVWNAFLSIFVVLSGENWNQIYFNQHRVTWHNWNVTATFYFMAVFVVGNLLLFNLFIAILLSNFDADEMEEDEEEDLEEKSKEVMLHYQFGKYRPPEQDANEQRKSNAGGAVPPTALPVSKNDGASPRGSCASLSSESTAQAPAKVSFQLPPCDATAGNGDRSLKLFSWANPVRRISARIVHHRYFDPAVITLILISTLCLAVDMPTWDENWGPKVFLTSINYVFTVIFILECVLKVIVSGFCFSKDKANPAYLRTSWNVLDFIVVVISIVSLMAEFIPSLDQVSGLKALRAMRALRPLRLISRNEELQQVVETLLRSIPKMATLSSVALLGFLIFSILGVELFGGKMGYCLDPEGASQPGANADLVERYGSRVIPGRRLVFKSNTNLKCPDGTSEDLCEWQNDYEECMGLSRYNLTRYTTDGQLLSDLARNDSDWLHYINFPQWVQPHFGSFDNIGLSLLMLVEVAMLEGWPDVMHRAMDTDMLYQYIEPYYISKSDDPPWELEEHSTGYGALGSIFFVLWIIIGCFVIMNMTIGVVVDTFSKIGEENDGCAFMTEDQTDWVKAQKQMIAMRPLRTPEEPPQLWRLFVFRIVMSTKFEMFIMSVIITNLCVMGMHMWWPDWEPIGNWLLGLQYANYVFLYMYVVEMILKMIGLGIRQYFQDRWNDFDFCLVVLSLIDFTLDFVDPSLNPVPPAIIRVIRLFRVVRVLRIIKTAKKLRTILMTVIVSIPALRNIGVLILLILFIFAVMCVNLFYAVNYTPGNLGTEDFPNIYRGYPDTQYADVFYSHNDHTNWGDFVNRHANFQHIGLAFLTLFRAATGEAFNGIMHDVMGGEWADNRLRCCPKCGPRIRDRNGNFKDPENSCGDTFFAVVIFILFMLMMAYIVLSLAVGVILENFANVGSENKKITMEMMEEFREVWLKYDRHGTFIVPSHNLLAILQQLKHPLGLAGKSPPLPRAQMLMHLGKLDIPDHGGKIHFMETLTAISNYHCGVPIPDCDTTKKIARAVSRVPGIQKLETPHHNALTNYLVSLLQSRWRGYAMRKKYSDSPEDGDDGEFPPDAMRIGEDERAGGGGALSEVPQQVPMAADESMHSKVKTNQVAPEP